MIGGQYWLLKPLSDSTSATSTETVVSSKPSVTTTTYNPDQVEQPTKISTPSPSPMDDKPKVKPRIRVRSRKTPPPPSPPQQPSYDEAPIMHKSDVEIQNLYRFNPGTLHQILGGRLNCLQSLTKTHSAIHSPAKVVNCRAMARQPILGLS